MIFVVPDKVSQYIEIVKGSPEIAVKLEARSDSDVHWVLFQCGIRMPTQEIETTKASFPVTFLLGCGMTSGLSWQLKNSKHYWYYLLVISHREGKLRRSASLVCWLTSTCVIRNCRSIGCTSLYNTQDFRDALLMDC